MHSFISSLLVLNVNCPIFFFIFFLPLSLSSFSVFCFLISLLSFFLVLLYIDLSSFLFFGVFLFSKLIISLGGDQHATGVLHDENTADQIAEILNLLKSNTHKSHALKKAAGGSDGKFFLFYFSFS